MRNWDVLWTLKSYYIPYTSIIAATRNDSGIRLKSFSSLNALQGSKKYSEQSWLVYMLKVQFKSLSFFIRLIPNVILCLGHHRFLHVWPNLRTKNMKMDSKIEQFDYDYNVLFGCVT